jgi:hypothetical protein
MVRQYMSIEGLCEGTASHMKYVDLQQDVRVGHQQPFLEASNFLHLFYHESGRMDLYPGFSPDQFTPFPKTLCDCT